MKANSTASRASSAPRHDVAVDVFALDLGTAAIAASAGGKPGANAASLPTFSSTMPDSDLPAMPPSLPRDEQLRMIDLNIRALTDLSLRFLPGMIAAPQRRHHQCRIRRGLHAGAGHGGLFCDQGLCALLQRRACRKNCAAPASPRHRCARVRSKPDSSSAGRHARRSLCRAGQAVERGGSRRAGWAAFGKGERMVVPGLPTSLPPMAAAPTPRRLLLPLLRRAMSTAPRLEPCVMRMAVSISRFASALG